MLWQKPLTKQAQLSIDACSSLPVYAERAAIARINDWLLPGPRFLEYDLCMAVVHISEEEARRDFGAVLTRFDEGDEVVIDRATRNVMLVGSTPLGPLTFAEAIARLPKSSQGSVDEDFAKDVQGFRDRHMESLDSSKWD